MKTKITIKTPSSKVPLDHKQLRTVFHAKSNCRISARIKHTLTVLSIKDILDLRQRQTVLHVD